RLFHQPHSRFRRCAGLAHVVFADHARSLDGETGPAPGPDRWAGGVSSAAFRAHAPATVSEGNMSQAELNKRLVDLLKPGAGLLLPGAPNALTARIIEAAGFPVVYLTGAGLANTYLGAPDMGLTTATELVMHIATIREAVSLPIIADGDTGFGNEL